MVEVQLVRGAAQNTAPIVALPDLLLDVRGDDSVAGHLAGDGDVFGRKVALVGLDRLQPELENVSPAVALGPGVHQVEVAVVRPEALVELLVDADEVWPLAMLLVSVSCLVELAVLRQPATVAGVMRTER